MKRAARFSQAEILRAVRAYGKLGLKVVVEISEKGAHIIPVGSLEAQGGSQQPVAARKEIVL
jgi:hypothetical protein